MRLRLPSGWTEVGTSERPIKLRTPTGWVNLSDGSGAALRVRRDADSWIKVSSATGQHFVTAEYTTTYLNNEYLGWEGVLENFYGYFQASGGEVVNPAFPPGEHPSGTPTAFPGARSTSEMGPSSYLGANLYYRETTDIAAWYAVPVGLLTDAATRWNSTAQVTHVEVVTTLVGGSYTSRGSVQTPYSGVGSLWYQGATPATYQSALGVNVVRDRPFQREAGGELLWTGSLNAIPASGVHHVVPPAIYPRAYSLQYRFQTSAVPGPDALSFSGPGTSTSNFLVGFGFKVSITYGYYD